MYYKGDKEGKFMDSSPGFGGTALMFPLLITESYYNRGLSLQRIAELTSFNPEIHHTLYPKKEQ